MIAVALKGLAGRKVRALLTAFAIVIGVSMVSGTFILTDTMQKSFDGLFTASYDKTDAVISGKEIVKNSTSGSGVTIPAALLAKVQALPEVEAAGGQVSPQEANVADIIGRDGKNVAMESLGGSIDPATRAFSPLKLKTGAVAQGPRRGRRSTPAPPPSSTTRLGDTVVVSTLGKRTRLPAHRHRLLRRRRLARLRQHRRLGHQDRPDAAAPRGPLRRHLDRRQARARRRRDLCAPSSRSCPPACRSRTAPRRPTTPPRSTARMA